MVTIDSFPDTAREFCQDLQTEITRLRRLLELKDEQIKLLNFRLFGPKQEKLSSAQLALLLTEVSVSAGEVQTEAQLPPAQTESPLSKARTPRGAHPGREPLPAHLERREVILPCAPEDCQCAQCGALRPVIGYDTREELVCEPAKFHVRVIKREKRGSHCLPEQGVVTAPAPAQIVPKSKLANELVIEVVIQKFRQHVPVYRQLATWATDWQLPLSRRTVNAALLEVGALLVPVVRAQAIELLAGGYVQADETPVPCQTGEKTGRNHRAYVWEYSVPGGVVVFDFRLSRGRDGPKEFLRGFRGTLQCDGYAAYDDLGAGITYAGCLSHARRTFVDAAKVAPHDPRPLEVMARFGEIYGVEQDARAAGLDAAQRLALRQQKSAPMMAALKDHLVRLRQSLAPGGALAKACDYTLNQWSRLEAFLRDGRIEVDNNWCEGAIRPLALGRKNWLHIGSAAAGPKVVAIAAIVETCRRLDINLRRYLQDVLPKLGDWPINRVGELTPTTWKATQQA